MGCIIPKYQPKKAVEMFQIKGSSRNITINRQYLPVDWVLAREGEKHCKCYWANQQNRNTNGGLKYCAHAKFPELITVLWLCKRIGTS